MNQRSKFCTDLSDLEFWLSRLWFSNIIMFQLMCVFLFFLFFFPNFKIITDFFTDFQKVLQIYCKIFNFVFLIIVIFQNNFDRDIESERDVDENIWIPDVHFDMSESHFFSFVFTQSVGLVMGKTKGTWFFEQTLSFRNNVTNPDRDEIIRKEIISSTKKKNWWTNIFQCRGEITKNEWRILFTWSRLFERATY